VHTRVDGNGGKWIGKEVGWMRGSGGLSPKEGLKEEQRGSEKRKGDRAGKEGWGVAISVLGVDALHESHTHTHTDS